MSMRQAREYIAETTGVRPHRNTLWRWYTYGVRKTKLRTRIVGGRRQTCVEWIHEFFDAPDRAMVEEEIARICATSKRPVALERSNQLAKRRLQEMGVL
jgi:hypothetical protein